MPHTCGPITEERSQVACNFKGQDTLNSTQINSSEYQILVQDIQYESLSNNKSAIQDSICLMAL